MFDINTSKEIQLLKKMIKLSKKYPDKKIPVADLPVSVDDFFLDILFKKNYITYTEEIGIKGISKGPDKFFVTESGYQVPYYLREHNKKFIRESILVPIVVSIATTGLIKLIPYLFHLNK